MKNIFFVIFLFTSSADGNDLLTQCIDAENLINNQEVKSSVNAAFCIGLIRSISNTLYIYESELKQEVNICWPDKGTNMQQNIRVVTKYLKEKPELLHEKEEVLILKAFINAFSCSNS